MYKTKKLLSSLAGEFEGKALNIITRSSFESRWTSCLNELKNSNINSITVFQSSSLSPEAVGTYSLLDGSIRDLLSTVSLKKSNPKENYKIIKATLEDIIRPEEDTISVIDISSFRREELFVVVLILKNLFINLPSINCKILYSEAGSMDEDWLSRNTLKIRTILGYSGDPKQSKRTCVISMIGHELHRAKDIIDAYDPSKLVIGKGMENESINTNLCDRNDKFYKEIKSYYGDECSSFEFSLLNPFKVKSLLSYVCRDQQYNYVIAPLNNKISCLGASLFALENQDVQVCYSEMLEYNRPTYSTPGKYVHLFEVGSFWD